MSRQCCLLLCVWQCARLQSRAIETLVGDRRRVADAALVHIVVNIVSVFHYGKISVMAAIASFVLV